MKEFETYRKSWNKKQTEFRGILLSFNRHNRSIQMFLSQHAALHSAKMVQTEPWSFEDEILNDMTEEQIRRIPDNEEHSVAWNIWHLARIEDVAMNLLVAGSPQVLIQKNWLERLKITIRNTGNLMSKGDAVKLSSKIELDALRAYRLAVGRRTHEIVKGLQPDVLQQKVDPARLQQVLDEGAVVEAACGLIDYWSRRDIAGLLLMPPTRHNFVHLNEALRLKRSRR